MTSRNSSGSSFSASGVEPTKSQNMTVSWRRSASGAAGRACPAVGDVVGRLAFLAVVVPWRLRPFAGRGVPAALKGMPQWPQNFACGAFSKLHWAQRRVSAVPHSLQNFSPSGFSNPQLRHCIGPLYSFGVSETRKLPAPEPSGSHLLRLARALLHPIDILPAGIYGRQ